MHSLFILRLLFTLAILNSSKTTPVDNNTQECPIFVHGQILEPFDEINITQKKFINKCSENIENYNDTKLYQNIRHLTIDTKNKINVTKIPERAFEKFVNLLKIKLNHTSFRKISEVIYPRSLMDVIYDFNAIEIPKNIPILEKFYGGTNQVQLIQMNFCNITNLYKESFENLQNLTVLQLSNNFLKSLPETIFDKNQLLHTLDLSNNFIIRLPNNIFCSNPNLISLNLKKNSILTFYKEIFCNIVKNLVVRISNKEDLDNQLDCTQKCEYLNENFLNTSSDMILIGQENRPVCSQKCEFSSENFVPQNVTRFALDEIDFKNFKGNLFCDKFFVVDNVELTTTTVATTVNTEEILTATETVDVRIGGNDVDVRKAELYAWIYVGFIIFIEIVIFVVLVFVFVRDRNKEKDL